MPILYFYTCFYYIMFAVVAIIPSDYFLANISTLTAENVHRQSFYFEKSTQEVVWSLQLDVGRSCTRLLCVKVRAGCTGRGAGSWLSSSCCSDCRREMKTPPHELWSDFICCCSSEFCQSSAEGWSVEATGGRCWACRPASSCCWSHRYNHRGEVRINLHFILLCLNTFVNSAVCFEENVPAKLSICV